MSRAYLPVYHALSGDIGMPFIDVGNEPDLRETPMTWGICRTTLRRWATPGTDLFFVAYPDGGHKRCIDERYYLTAYLHVAEWIGQDEAVRRFPCRQNVILDHLPSGSSLTERVSANVCDHASKLAW